MLVGVRTKTCASVFVSPILNIMLVACVVVLCGSHPCHHHVLITSAAGGAWHRTQRGTNFLFKYNIYVSGRRGHIAVLGHVYVYCISFRRGLGRTRFDCYAAGGSGRTRAFLAVSGVDMFPRAVVDWFCWNPWGSVMDTSMLWLGLPLSSMPSMFRLLWQSF